MHPASACTQPPLSLSLALSNEKNRRIMYTCTGCAWHHGIIKSWLHPLPTVLLWWRTVDEHGDASSSCSSRSDTRIVLLLASSWRFFLPSVWVMSVSKMGCPDHDDGTRHYYETDDSTQDGFLDVNNIIIIIIRRKQNATSNHHAHHALHQHHPVVACNTKRASSGRRPRLPKASELN